MTHVVSTLPGYLSFSKPGVKAFTDALSASLNSAPKQTTKNCKMRQMSALWLWCCCYAKKKETRYIMKQMCHQLATSKSYPTRNPPGIQCPSALTHLLTAWVVSRCSAATSQRGIWVGGSALRNHGEAKWNAWSSNLATHPNINNNPSKSCAATF